MQNISEVFHLKLEYRAKDASKKWLQAHISAMLKMVLLTLAGFIVLVGLSSAVWFATWHADISTIKWSVN